ncbi:hypothetical protein [Flavobacterium sp. HJJ]|uniref:hypothetical protein n=1 Tax=Flavobacterium sp. HJJ TaxID=2783792 RepID=UPI00188AC4AF|nr:hypothetical protein [Flavobacterium sp. HJJ]MBF4472435.1 hypothetical protein [Flavobacterium sp. HJJ]
MKLNKMNISRLTKSQAQAIKGGYGGGGSGGSTIHNFTCTWCTGGGNSFECSTQNPNDIACNTTRPNTYATCTL